MNNPQEITRRAERRLKRLVMRMAENRAQHREVQRQIQDFYGAYPLTEEPPNLDQFRAEWMGGDYPGAENCGPWQGWVAALENAETEYTPEQMRLAELFDRKKALRLELGQIRRSLCAVGRGLLRTHNGAAACIAAKE